MSERSRAQAVAEEIRGFAETVNPNGAREIWVDSAVSKYAVRVIDEAFSGRAEIGTLPIGVARV